MSSIVPKSPSEQQQYAGPDEVSVLAESLESLLAALQKNGLAASYPNRAFLQPTVVARFLLDLQLFVDKALGEKATIEKRFAVKLPAAYLRDFKDPQGPLGHIITWCVDYCLKRNDRGDNPFDVFHDDDTTCACSLVIDLWQRLRSSGLWSVPQVFFWGEPAQYEDLAHLQSIITTHGGAVTDRLEEASHIILPIHVINAEDQEHYFRPIMSRNGRVFVHWWYFPDSFDAWTTTDDDTTAHPILPPEDGKWKLGVEWVLLMERYNEWMNEGDFEVDTIPDRLQIDLDAVCQSIITKRRDRVSEPYTKAKQEPADTMSAEPKGQGVEVLVKRKRGRPRLTYDSSRSASTVTGPPKSPVVPPTLSSGSSSLHDKKRARINSEAASTSVAGKYIVSYLGDGIQEPGTFETLQSCAIEKLSADLETAVALQDATSVSLSNPVSDIDSDTENMAQHALALQRSQTSNSVAVVPDDPGSNLQEKADSLVSHSTSRQSSPTYVTSGAVGGASTTEQAPLPETPSLTATSSVTANLTEGPVRLGPSGILRYPPRSLELSVITDTKDGFRVIGNITPYDYDHIAFPQDAFPRGSKSQRRADLEAAMPEMFRLWGAVSTDVSQHDNNLPLSKAEDPVLPDSLHWFSMDAIHPIEKEQFNAIFLDPSGMQEGSKGTSLDTEYQSLRNSIIELYRQAPHCRLSFSSCRRHVPCKDSTELLRLYTLLDYWGLINFQAKPPFSNRCVTASHCHGSRLLDVNLAESDDADRLDDQWSSASVQCVVCKRQCLKSYYVLRPGSAHGVSLDTIYRKAWCTRCFSNGRYPGSLSQRSFVQATESTASTMTPNSSRQPSMTPWSASEVTRLLEAIEMYGENWDAIAEQIGTRSAVDCVSQFLRLPLEESVLHPFVETAANDTSSSTFRNIFGDAKNPLMAQLNFISSFLGPKGAILAAKAAADVLLRSLDEDDGGFPGTTGDHHANLPEAVASSHAGASTSPLCLSKSPTDVPQEETLPQQNGTVSAVPMVSPTEESTLARKLQAPLTKAQLTEAASRALETAAQLARDNLVEEERSICKMMRQLNAIKQQQLQQKMKAFYLQKDAWDRACTDVSQKLLHCAKTRDMLIAKLQTATEESQKVVSDYQLERQQKQQQQFQQQQQHIQAQLYHQQQQQLQLQQQRQLQQQHFQTTHYQESQQHTAFPQGLQHCKPSAQTPSDTPSQQQYQTYAPTQQHYPQPGFSLYPQKPPQQTAQPQSQTVPGQSQLPLAQFSSSAPYSHQFLQHQQPELR